MPSSKTGCNDCSYCETTRNNVSTTPKVTHVLPLSMAMKVEEYIREDASNPYKQWFDGMGEYVIDWGPGYRIYLAKDGDVLIVLFGGGTKRGQQRDIDKAKELLAEYKTRKKAMTLKSSSKYKGK